LFKPFRKSAHEAARTAPGVGLGLALCRRLSRSMGGDLRLARSTEGGACFELRLPFNAAAVTAPSIG
jgi:signal transduction histidine kinase